MEVFLYPKFRVDIRLALFAIIKLLYLDTEKVSRGEKCSKTARIIVDVPLMQTDKPFSYAIPTELQEMIE